jgi:hypothetical protein
MTTTQLAMLLCRKTEWGAPSEMPAGDALAMITCMNQAFQLWMEKANAPFVSVPDGRQMLGKLALSLTATAGSRSISLTPPNWLPLVLGSHIDLGDGQPNRILSATQLQRPYLGTTGAVMATVSHDAVGLGSDTVSMCSGVRYVHGRDERPLQNSPLPAHWSQGTPTFYDIEPLSPGDGSSPAFVLRIWPFPDQVASLSFSMARHWSAPVNAHLEAVAIPAPDDVVTGILYPISRYLCAGEGLYKEADLRGLRMAHDEALARIHPRTRSAVIEPGMMGTARGF